MTRARRDDGPILVGKRRDTPEIEALLDAFVRDKLRAGRPTRRSLDTYEMHLRPFLRYRTTTNDGHLEIDGVTQKVVEDYVAVERERGLATSTLTTKLMAARSLFGWLIETERHRGPNPASGVRPPRSTTRPRDPYRPEDANTILACAWSRPEDLRWVVAAHIVSLGFATGLRPGELSDLKLSDVDLERRRLAVFGKGAKHRSVVLGDDAVVLLTRYLTEIRPKLGDSKYLFVNPTSEAGGNWVGRYRAQSFADHFLVVGRLSGLPGVHHPHRLRHTYATDMLRRGLDVTVLQRQLGHSKVTTTTGYLHLVDDDVENAVRAAHGQAPRTEAPPIDILPRHYRTPAPERAVADGASQEADQVTDDHDEPPEVLGPLSEPTEASSSPRPLQGLDPSVVSYAVTVLAARTPADLSDIPEELTSPVLEVLIAQSAQYLRGRLHGELERAVVSELIAEVGTVLARYGYDQDISVITGIVASVVGQVHGDQLPLGVFGVEAHLVLATGWAVARAAASRT